MTPGTLYRCEICHRDFIRGDYLGRLVPYLPGDCCHFGDQQITGPSVSDGANAVVHQSGESSLQARRPDSGGGE